MTDEDDIHVTPLNDLREHADSRECWCKPVIYDEADMPIVVYNSMDRREHTIEKGRVQ
jgi:hypothetical protein